MPWKSGIAVEQVMGIEPTWSAWEAEVLPLNYTRTQGRGMYTMQFDHYEEVPKSVAEKVVGKRN